MAAEEEARIIFAATTFQVIRPGRFVVCAVTGQAVALADLRYWSVERQEAYASAEAALEGWRRAQAARRPRLPAA